MKKSSASQVYESIRVSPTRKNPNVLAGQSQAMAYAIGFWWLGKERHTASISGMTLESAIETVCEGDIYGFT